MRRCDNPCGRYVLDDAGDPVEEPDLVKWAKWLDTADRKIARTDIGPFVVSTVFLGLDHRFCGDGPPLLYETMVFRGDEGPHHDILDAQWRTSTRADAQSAHDWTSLEVQMIAEREGLIAEAVADVESVWQAVVSSARH